MCRRTRLLLASRMTKNACSSPLYDVVKDGPAITSSLVPAARRFLLTFVLVGLNCLLEASFTDFNLQRLPCRWLSGQHLTWLAEVCTSQHIVDASCMLITSGIGMRTRHLILALWKLSGLVYRFEGLKST